MVLLSASAAAMNLPSSAEAGWVVCSTPDGSSSLLSSQKTAPDFLFSMITTALFITTKAVMVNVITFAALFLAN